MNFHKRFPETFIWLGTRSFLFDQLESFLWAHALAHDEVANDDCWCPGDSSIAMYKHWPIVKSESAFNESASFRQFLFERALGQIQQVQKVMNEVIDRYFKVRNTDAENVSHFVQFKELLINSHVLGSDKQIWKHAAYLKHCFCFISKISQSYTVILKSIKV